MVASCQLSTPNAATREENAGLRGGNCSNEDALECRRIEKNMREGRPSAWQLLGAVVRCFCLQVLIVGVYMLFVENILSGSGNAGSQRGRYRAILEDFGRNEMGLFSKFFGGRSKEEPKSHQLPSDVVCKEFGEVDVRRTPQATEVFFTILMEPQGREAEGWQTGVALDASASMENSYGKGLGAKLKGDIPKKVTEEYLRKGWIKIYRIDGQNVPVISPEGKQDLVSRGYFDWTENEIQPLARRMTKYLASSLDANGGTTVLYWACGADGKQVELLGDLTTTECETTVFEGPKDVSFGQGTHLGPAVRHFVDRFKEAKRGMYIFVTDGQLHDLDDVKQYTKQLAEKIEAGERNSVKCVLIGIGDDIDESQMEELDDLETGTDVDIWDHKIAKEMRALIEIFAEVVSENTIVAPTATIYDDSGQVVTRFPDGLPAKVTFEMSPTSDAFELEVAGRRIQQTLLSRKSL